ncbi:MAG: hypothetical protein QM718_06495 [Steroidobacteraceae bacterium]
MNAGWVDVVERCARACDDDSIAFAEMLGMLTEAGVECYHADLRRAEKTYYLPDGASEVIRCELVTHPPALRLSVPALQEASSAIQSHRITYREFCNRITAAGCVGYIVSLLGQRTVFIGRSGETYVGFFPRGS